MNLSEDLLKWRAELTPGTFWWRVANWLYQKARKLEQK